MPQPTLSFRHPTNLFYCFVFLNDAEMTFIILWFGSPCNIIIIYYYMRTKSVGCQFNPRREEELRVRDITDKYGMA